MIRRLFLAAGVAAGLLGLLLVAAPGIAGDLAVSRILVYLLGLVALILAVLRIQRRRNAERRQTETPEPETPVSLPRPGGDVDVRIRNLKRVVGRGQVKSERQDLDTRLEELAIRVIARRDDVSRDTARSRLHDGSWTDDPLAAAYFAEGVTVPIEDRVRLSVGTGSPSGVYAARAIEELAGRKPAGESDG